MAEKFEFNDEQDEKFQFDDDQNKRFQFNDDEEIENSNINNDDIETFDNDDERLDYSNNKKREKNDNNLYIYISNYPLGDCTSFYIEISKIKHLNNQFF